MEVSDHWMNYHAWVFWLVCKEGTALIPETGMKKLIINGE